MQSNRLRSIGLFLLAGISLLIFLSLGLPSVLVAHAHNAYVFCSPKAPCTDTPTYPPKETATYPPKVTDTSPPQDTDTNTPRPTRTRTPPSATPTYAAPTSTTAPSQTDTPKPTDLGVSSTPSPTGTAKPTVLGQTGTPIPSATATLPLLIPVFQPTSTLAPLSALPLPVPGDIWVTGMEITQAIQIYGVSPALDNSIPLVAGKKTVVRVYVQSDNYSPRWDRVTGRLTVTGGREPGRILEPVTENSSGTIQVSPSGSDRNRPWDSFTFFLDQDETSTGSRHLAVDIFSITPRPELNTANNHREMDIHFVSMPAISIIGVVYGNDGTDPHTPAMTPVPWSDFNRHWFMALNMAPVANFSITYLPGLGSSPMMFPNLDVARSWADRILAQPGFSNARLYLLQPEQDCNCGYAANRRMNGQDNRRDAGHVLAQEVAHSMGMWWHAVSPDFPADMANPDYPYEHSQTGPQVGEMTIPGISPPAIPISPNLVGFATHDFMSYATSNTWVSPFTYCTYMNTLTGGRVTCPPGADHASLGTPTGTGSDNTVAYHLPGTSGGTYLYAAGTILPDGSASFQPFEQFISAHDISDIPSGDQYHLVFQDKDGKTLNDIPFKPEETHHDEKNPTVFFNLTVPYPAGIARILLVKDGKTLAEKDASAHAPTLDFSFDGQGKTLGGTQHFSWKAADEDNDPLIYNIEYSRDGGQTWQTLNVGLTNPAADINFDNLPGSDHGMLRVSASDGVNSSFATSTGTFKVARKAPIITSVSPNQITYQGQAVYVEISAFDWEDGPLTDPSSINWSSDLDGKLTSGSWIAPGTLSVGDHTLTATVTDSDGNTTKTSVNVMVLAADPLKTQKPISFWLVLFEFGLPILLLFVLTLAGIFLLRRRK